MKTQWISMGVAVALTVVGSGCLVQCRFEKRSEAKGGEYVSSICHGSIVSCNSGDSGCKNTLKIECDDIPVYYGPYIVHIKNNLIRYTASDWHGPDAPYITTEIPQNDHDVVRAWEQDDDNLIKGSCRYDYQAD